MVSRAKLQLLHHQPVCCLRNDLECGPLATSIIPKSPASWKRASTNCSKRTRTSLAATASSTCGRGVSVTGCGSRAAFRSRLCSGRSRRWIADGQDGFAPDRFYNSRRVKISTRMTSRAWASTVIASLRYKTTVALRARSSCSCRSSAWRCRKIRRSGRRRRTTACGWIWERAPRGQCWKNPGSFW